MSYMNILICDKCGKEIAEKEIFYYINKKKKVNSKGVDRVKDLAEKITDGDFEGDVCKDCLIDIFFKDKETKNDR